MSVAGHGADYAAVAAFADEIARGGVAHACISPGSRSTPLALVFAAHPGVRAWSHVDERSGAFFALGIAKASRRPVALVCTSGTAAANFFPAVVEAAYAHVPLIVLTADRPPELRDCGAGQTIDQLKLYGSHVKWFAEAGEVGIGARYFRSLAARAAAAAAGRPPGPVHVNFPFREPLVPAPGADLTAAAALGRGAERPYTTVYEAAAEPSAAAVAELAGALAASRRGVIACGPLDADEDTVRAVVGLAARLGWPVLADPLAQMRSGRHDTSCVVGPYDALLRAESFVRRAAPDLILRFGPMPTSKAFLQYVQRYEAVRHVVVDPLGPWQDPARIASDMILADPAALCAAVAGRLPAPAADREWLRLWQDAARRAEAAIAAGMRGSAELFEGRVFVELADILPDGATLYAGSSMPVRDLESFWPNAGKRLRVLSNRGANGIDGFVSSGLGAAAAGAGPLVMVTGDLGFYHDLNGLLAAKRYGLRAAIVVLNNDGGGIFSFLSQADCGEPFEEFFLTPHGLDFRAAAELYGCAFARVGGWDEFRSAVRDAIAAPRTSIVEVPVDRTRNVELHRRIWADAQRAIA